MAEFWKMWRIALVGLVQNLPVQIEQMVFFNDRQNLGNEKWIELFAGLFVQFLDNLLGASVFVDRDVRHSSRQPHR